MPIGSFYSHREDPVNTYAAAATSPSSAFRRDGFANIAYAHRSYGHDNQRIPHFTDTHEPDIKNCRSYNTNTPGVIAGSS